MSMQSTHTERLAKMIKYSITANTGTGVESITILFNGEVFVADNMSHPNYERIVAAARAGDEDIVNILDIGRDIGRQFNRLSERVTVVDDDLLFDGSPAQPGLSLAILRLYRAGEDFMPLVRFLERVEQNPSEHSRSQLWEWLNRHQFTITDEGNFIAYKGVNADSTSINSGKAIVDDVEVSGNIPNHPGSVVEMPRDEVTSNPALGCSYGLHAGTYDYAESFARGLILTVEINPRDVVSVPTDCDHQKLRVCRYKVLQATLHEWNFPVLHPYEDDEIWPYEDFDGHPWD
jgi:hypothetical protein